MDEVEYAVRRGMPRFEGRRCTAEHKPRSGSFCEDLRGVARDVAWCLLIFVRPLVLFVDHDQLEVYEWSKERGARTDDESDFSARDCSPCSTALATAEFAMKHGDFLRGEQPCETADEVFGEKNFRKEYERLPSWCECIGD